MSSLTPSQQAALQTAGNVLVMAGAGTGKTRTLVERCCALLESGGVLDEILMVTFTDAAAAEMRHRIQLHLAGRRDKLMASHPSIARHLDEQLALLDTADISTIHSFCLKLIREHFHHEQLQLDPELTVFSDAQIHQIKHDTLDTLLAARYESDTAEAKAFRDFVTVRAQGNEVRVRELIWRIHRYTQSLTDPAGWFDRQLDHFAQAEPTQWRAWFAASFAECRARWVTRLTPSASSKNVELCLTALGNLPAQPSPGEIAIALAEISAAYQSDWPRGHAGKVRDALNDCFSEAEFLHSLTLSTDSTDPFAQDWDWTRHHMLTLLELTRAFSSEFARAKRDLGGVDFADLEQFALRLLWNAATQSPTDIAKRWRDRLKHVFVDEYQDINAAQDTILRALSREGADANRFLVGDVKQSIYRFRLADPTIFQNYKRAWETDATAGRTIPLADNFRSRQGLLDFINPLFRELMREEIGGVQYDAAAELKFGTPEKREPLRRTPGDEPAVELQLLLKSSPEDNNGDDDANEGDTAATEFAALESTEKEARRIAQRLHELREQRLQVWDETSFRDVQWRDMVILLRSPAGKVESFAKEFNRAGIPLHATRGGFYDTTEISDLLSLLQLLDNPLQDIPLLAVLRSPLVGLSLDELAVIHAAFPKEKFWTATSLICFKQTTLSAGADAIIQTARPRLQALHESFGRWRKLARTGALSDCLEAVLVESHYEAMLLAMPRGAERRANVIRFLQLIRQFDPYQRQGLIRFLQFVETQRDAEAEEEPAAPAITDAVRLISIHKSKGLEFPVVVLPDLAKSFNLQDLSGDVLLDARFGLCPRVVPPRRNGHYTSLPHWLARRRQLRDTLGEELRLLYVALTRARDRLILSASTSAKKVDDWRKGGTGEPITTDDILGARNYFAWLQLWLSRTTSGGDWKDDRSGTNSLLQWNVLTDNDPQPDSKSLIATLVPTSPPATLPVETAARLAWQYQFDNFTTTTAKTSVTALRRRAADETTDEARKLFQSKRRASRTPPGKLSAAEIGLAHHSFLQWVKLARTDSETELRAEAERLGREGLLSAEQADMLDFKLLAAFWGSDIAMKIRSQATSVKRELAFTARFEATELDQLIHVTPGAGAPPAAASMENFIVVQGVADLVVLLPEEIWLLDFKTDRISEDELLDKVKLYEPQLKIYALALSRIYKKPVTQCWLHFLAAQKTVPVEPPTCV